MTGSKIARFSDLRIYNRIGSWFWLPCFGQKFVVLPLDPGKRRLSGHIIPGSGSINFSEHEDILQLAEAIPAHKP
jgi:hypothetical protein